MNEKFDELAKGLAHSVSRRGLLRKLGIALAAAVLASLGLATKAQAKSHIPGKPCTTSADCPGGKVCLFGYCTRL